jgi:hypothetical protein
MCGRHAIWLGSNPYQSVNGAPGRNRYPIEMTKEIIFTPVGTQLE